MPEGTTNDGGTNPSEGQPPTPPDPGQQPLNGDPAGEPSKSGEPTDPPDYEALYKKAQDDARKWESRAKGNSAKAKKWDEAEAKNRTESEQATERATKAEERAQAAITRAVTAEIRAAARGWAKPEDAPRYLDDKAKYVDEDGSIDTEAIVEDLAAVLKERPHLAVSKGDGRRAPNPDPGQGHRGTPSLGDQIAAAEKAGNHREALRLKTQQLLQSNQNR